MSWMAPLSAIIKNDITSTEHKERDFLPSPGKSRTS